MIEKEKLPFHQFWQKWKFFHWKGIFSSVFFFQKHLFIAFFQSFRDFATSQKSTSKKIQHHSHPPPRKIFQWSEIHQNCRHIFDHFFVNNSKILGLKKIKSPSTELREKNSLCGEDTRKNSSLWIYHSKKNIKVGKIRDKNRTLTITTRVSGSRHGCPISDGGSESLDCSLFQKSQQLKVKHLHQVDW